MKSIKVIYEDNHLLAVEKPVNMPVQKDISNDMDLLSALKQYIKKKYHKPGNVFLGLVHRLDRPVGGVMVFARTSKAASRLSEQIRARKMMKLYLAVAEGTYPAHEGTYVDHLFKERERNLVRVVSEDTPGNRKAILQYEVIETQDKLSLVRIHLETGRSHQIRVQFSHHAHPLFGDRKYGSAKYAGSHGGPALWSYQLVFRHPVRDELIRVTSMPPVDPPWNLFPWILSTRNLKEE